MAIHALRLVAEQITKAIVSRWEFDSPDYTIADARRENEDGWTLYTPGAGDNVVITEAVHLPEPSLMGAYLRGWRDAQKWTQAQLADALNVRPNTIARWERGVMKIESPAMLTLALERLAARPAGSGPVSETDPQNS